MNPWVEAKAEHADRLIGGQEFPHGEDMLEVLDAFGARLQGRVVEIGCGVGRLATLCGDYTGYDVSPAFVGIAQSNGIDARLLPVQDGERADWLVIAHVFPHITKPERREYLTTDIAPRLLVDICPGNKTLGWPLIYEDNPARFEEDLAEAGWRVEGFHDRPESDYRHWHRYFLCAR